MRFCGDFPWRFRVKEMEGTHLQVLIPVSLIVSAFFMPLFYRWSRKWCEPVAIGVSFLCFIFSWIILLKVLQSPTGAIEYFPGYSWSGARHLPTGEPIGIVMHTDIYGAFMLLQVTALGFLATLYSLKYIPHTIPEEKIGLYYTLLLLFIAGMSGLSLTGDYFNFYIFLEVSGISSYALVAIASDKKAIEAALKYAIIGTMGSIFLLFAIALLYASTGSLNMAYGSQQIGKIFASDAPEYLIKYRYHIYAALGFLIAGFSIKSAFFPVHAWLADAHPAAPSSISALLSGIFVKVSGLFYLIRFLFTIFGVHKGYYGFFLPPFFIAVMVLTALGGSIFAVAQTDLKRMLAFSTVSQMGYILAGIALLSKEGLTGSILHIFNHALMKGLLFFCAGSIIYKTGIRKISDLRGIGYKMPVTMGCFTIGALAIMGIPPLCGFMSKWYLLTASAKAGYPVLIVVLLTSSLLAAIYYLRVVGIAFFVPPPTHSETGELQRVHPKVEESPISMLIPIICLSLAVIFMGIFVRVPLKVVEKAAEVLFK